MNKATFLQLVQRPDRITDQDLQALEEVAHTFPYCQLAHLLLAKGSHDQGNMHASQRLRKAALYAASRTLLKQLLTGPPPAPLTATAWQHSPLDLSTAAPAAPAPPSPETVRTAPAPLPAAVAPAPESAPEAVAAPPATPSAAEQMDEPLVSAAAAASADSTPAPETEQHSPAPAPEPFPRASAEAPTDAAPAASAAETESAATIPTLTELEEAQPAAATELSEEILPESQALALEPTVEAPAPAQLDSETVALLLAELEQTAAKEEGEAVSPVDVPAALFHHFPEADLQIEEEAIEDAGDADAPPADLPQELVPASAPDDLVPEEAEAAAALTPEATGTVLPELAETEEELVITEQVAAASAEIEVQQEIENAPADPAFEGFAAVEETAVAAAAVASAEAPADGAPAATFSPAEEPVKEYPVLQESVQVLPMETPLETPAPPVQPAEAGHPEHPEPYRLDEQLLQSIFARSELAYRFAGSRLGEALELPSAESLPFPREFHPELIVEYLHQEPAPAAAAEPAPTDAISGPADAEEQPEGAVQQSIIDNFLKENPRLRSLANGLAKTEPQEDLSSKSTKLTKALVSENLALIYERQGKVKKAIKIYQQLSLKMPEKKEYFAAQIFKLQNQG